MRRLFLVFLFLLLYIVPVSADLQEGDALPNPTLKSLEGEEIPLYDMLNKVTVIHLWKCN